MEATLSEVLSRFGSLAPDDLSNRVCIGGLRATNRQRFSKALHFVCLRCPEGCTIEGVLRADVMQLPQVGSCYRLGDTLSVEGIIETRSGRLSVRVEQLQVQEAWVSVFGKAAFLYDWDAASAMEASRWGAASALLLQVPNAQGQRLLEHMEERGTRVITVIRPVANVRHMECGVLIEATDPRALVRALAADPLLSRVVQRVYLLEDRCATFAAAVAALAARLAVAAPGSAPSTALKPAAQNAAVAAAPATQGPLAAAASGSEAAHGGVVARVAAFPRALETVAAERLDALGVAVRPRRYDALACVAYIHGCFLVGVARLADFGGDMWSEERRGGGNVQGGADSSSTLRGLDGSPQPGLDGSPHTAAAAAPKAATEAARDGNDRRDGDGHGHTDDTVSAEAARARDGQPVCRAYYKLKEVSSRRLLLPLHTASVAIDVGAAPGGWTSFLAAEGCGSVIAIDPGEMNLGEPPPVVVEHMRMKLQDALPVLHASAIAADLYCCDMNAPPALVVDLFVEAIPLLRPGAQLVLTFKNVYPKRAVWEAQRDAQLARLTQFAQEVNMLQLFANTPRECTVLGIVKPI